MNEPPLDKTQFEALSTFRYELRRFLRVSERLCAREGITGLQYLLLLHLKGYPGRDWATISELAERLQSHHHGVVALASRCERAGLVVRRPGRSDRRHVELHLTAQGEACIARLARAHQGELHGLQATVAASA